jgi:hypothetical protein
VKVTERPSPIRRVDKGIVVVAHLQIIDCEADLPWHCAVACFQPKEGLALFSFNDNRSGPIPSDTDEAFGCWAMFARRRFLVRVCREGTRRYPALLMNSPFPHWHLL